VKEAERKQRGGRGGAGGAGRRRTRTFSGGLYGGGAAYSANIGWE